MRGVTHHAKLRINERGDESVHTYNKNLYALARKNGIKFQKYKDSVGKTPFVKFLNYKENANPFAKVILYLDFVFIFNKSYTKIITVYKIPSKHLNEYYDFLVKKELRQQHIFPASTDNNSFCVFITYEGKLIDSGGRFIRFSEACKYAEKRIRKEKWSKNYYSSKERNHISLLNYALEKEYVKISLIRKSEAEMFEEEV